MKYFINRKKKIAQIYDKKFKNIDVLEIPKVQANISHSYHLYPLRIKFDKLKITKDQLLKKLRSKGINLQVHYIPIYNHNLYRVKNKLKFPNTEIFFNQAVSLPIYYSLKDRQVKLVIKIILKIIFSNLKNNTKI